jgi:hypothetical protein
VEACRMAARNRWAGSSGSDIRRAYPTGGGRGGSGGWHLANVGRTTSV